MRRPISSASQDSGQLRLDLPGALVAGTAERRPQVRPLDDAVEGDVGRVDDLAHGREAFHELVLGIRSDPVLLERTNPRPAGDVLVHLTRDSGVALHRQIEASIRDAIRAGRLPRGTSLPPTRSLADELGVSRGVVVEAYQQLIAEGYLTSRAGGYTRVAIGPELPARSAVARAGRGGDGSTSAHAEPTARSSRAPRGCARCGACSPSVSDEEFGYVSGRGAPALHQALAAYLNRVRGTSARPDHIVICNGYAQGIGLLIQTLATSGAKRLALEDPSADDDALPLARAAGLEVVGVPVDEDGIRVDALDRTDADALVLTPSHQWPTGAVLSAERRAAVLRWARERRALVIEDDYDAEYRYDRAPDRSHAGSRARTSSPTPGPRARRSRPGCDWGGSSCPPASSTPSPTPRSSPIAARPSSISWPSPTSWTAGSSIATCAGCVPLYRRRRDALLAALREHAPELEPAGIAAGLHLVAYLPDGVDEAAVVEAAARRGVAVYGLAPYRISARAARGSSSATRPSTSARSPRGSRSSLPSWRSYPKVNT